MRANYDQSLKALMVHVPECGILSRIWFRHIERDMWPPVYGICLRDSNLYPKGPLP